MNKERSGKAEWHSPPCIYGGIDMIEYYSYNFLGLLAGRFMADNYQNDPRVLLIDDNPYSFLNEFHSRVTIRRNDMENFLVENRLYSRKRRTVFSDYKKMLKMSLIKLGKESGERDQIRARAKGLEIIDSWFSLDMPLEEAIKKAMEFVSTWCWEK